MTTENATVETFGEIAVRLYDSATTHEKCVVATIASWTPLIHARMAELGVVADELEAPHAELVKQVRLEFYTQMFNANGGDNQAMRDLQTIAGVKGAAFTGVLRDWKHLQQVLGKTGAMGTISAGAKNVNKEYSELLTKHLHYREKAVTATERAKRAAKEAASSAPPSTPDATPPVEAVPQGTTPEPLPAADAPDGYAPAGFKVIQVPSDMPIQEAIVALMQAYQIEPGAGYCNLIATLAAAHDYLEQLAASEAVAPELVEAGA
jgi:hypothetical protein